LAIALISTSWIVINDKDYFSNSLVYFLFGSLAFMFYYTVHPLFKFIGITKKDFIQDSIPGLVAGIGFIFVNYLSSMVTLGIPTMVAALATSESTFAVGGAIVISVFVAPIIEEVIFRGFLQKVLEKVFFNWIVAGVITSFSILYLSLVCLRSVFCYGFTIYRSFHIRNACYLSGQKDRQFSYKYNMSRNGECVYFTYILFGDRWIKMKKKDKEVILIVGIGIILLAIFGNLFSFVGSPRELGDNSRYFNYDSQTNTLKWAIERSGLGSSNPDFVTVFSGEARSTYSDIFKDIIKTNYPDKFSFGGEGTCATAEGAGTYYFLICPKTIGDTDAMDILVNEFKCEKGYPLIQYYVDEGDDYYEATGNQPYACQRSDCFFI